jgi:hypothetical protein
MAERCPKCSHKLQSNDFLCPHCGHILGQPVTAAPVPAKEQTVVLKKKRKFPWAILLGVLLLTLLAVVIFLMGGSEPAPTTAPTEPSTTTQPAPLVPYEVQVKNAANRPMGGVQIHMYKGQELLFTFEADKQGKATFVLPQCDEYYVMLSNLPIPYNLTHEDMTFPFETGQQTLVLKLEKLDVSYTVRVVDEAGQPIEGVRMEFGKGDQITDAQGICTLTGQYVHTGVNCRILYAPTGYYVEPGLHYFQEGTALLEVVLQRMEDVQLQEDQQIYTLSLVDEYGNPVVGQRVGVTLQSSVDMLDYVVWTNADGVATFIAPKDRQVSVTILEQVDYYGKLYPYEPGSTHLQLQIEIRKTSFTYTLQFLDQAKAPIAGVVVCAGKIDSSEYAFYTTDENGCISFESTEADPEKVGYRIMDVPEGYWFDESVNMMYSFSAYSRSEVVDFLVFRPTVITLVDDQGQPVVGAELLLQSIFGTADDKRGFTDENGQCVFFLQGNMGWIAMVDELPEAYAHLFFGSIYMDGSSYDITIRPSAIYQTYHVYVRDDEGRPVANAEAALYLQIGLAYVIVTDAEGYAKFDTWTEDASQIESVKITELPDEYEGYDFYTVTYGEDNCIYITISPERIHTEG